MAVPDPAIAERLGAEHTALLSRWTAAKQLFRHADLRPQDYARVQRVLDEGRLYLQRGGDIVGHIEEDGRWWRVAIKATPKGELYLSMYHRSRERQELHFSRRWPRIQQGKRLGVRNAPAGHARLSVWLRRAPEYTPRQSRTTV